MHTHEGIPLQIHMKQVGQFVTKKLKKPWWTYIYTYTDIYIYTCIHIYIHTYKHIHTHIYTYITYIYTYVHVLMTWANNLQLLWYKSWCMLYPVADRFSVTNHSSMLSSASYLGGLGMRLCYDMPNEVVKFMVKWLWQLNEYIPFQVSSETPTIV